MKGKHVLPCLCAAVLFWGCASSDEEKKEAEKAKQEAKVRREEWFRNAPGKPAPEQRPITSEWLAEPETPPELRNADANPYPIYSADGKSPENPEPLPPGPSDTEAKLKADFDFIGTPFADVVPVFAELLKFNYHLDGKINGTVTLSLHDELTRSELRQLLRQLAHASGVYLNTRDKLVHFRPVETMPQSSGGDPAQSDAETALFQLKNIGAKETAAQLAQFLSPGLKPLVLEDRNLLLVVDTKENLARLRQVVARLDQPLRKGWAKMVIPCRNISAARLAQEAGEILPVIGFPISVNKDKPRPEEIQLTAVERLDVIVASAANHEALEELGRWINILDRSDTGEQERMFIYNILNSKAEELVKALAAMFPVEGTTLTPTKSGSSGTASGGEEKVSSSTSASSASSSSSAAVKSSKTAKSGDAGAASVFDVPVKVFADAVNNRLLIRTKPKAYAMVKALLGKIDTIPPQVLFQVLVVDVSLNDSIKFGVEFMTQGGNGSVQTVGGTNYSNLTPNSGQKAQNGGQFWVFNPDNPDEKYGYVNALAGKTQVKVISSPQVLIASHEEAKISVGAKVPIVNSEITNTQSTVTANNDSSTNLVRNIQYQDTGVILKLTPRVTRGGRIGVRMEQTVSEADKNNISDIDSPVIKEQIIETSMSIRDGQTIICGGIIKEKITDKLSTLPILGGMPFVRRLVGDSDVATERTEMMILVTAYIVNENSKLEELVKRYEQAVDALVEFHEPAEARQRKVEKNKGLLETWFIE